MTEVPEAAYGSPGRTASRLPPKAGTIAGPTCWRCQRTLADYLTPPYSLRCQRCKAQNTAPST